MNIDTEGMRSAANNMNAAAERLNDAARNMQWVVDSFERVSQNFIAQLADTLHDDRQARGLK